MRGLHTGGSGSLAVWESTSLSPRVLGFQVGDRRACHESPIAVMDWTSPRIDSMLESMLWMMSPLEIGAPIAMCPLRTYSTIPLPARNANAIGTQPDDLEHLNTLEVSPASLLVLEMCSP